MRNEIASLEEQVLVRTLATLEKPQLKNLRRLLKKKKKPPIYFALTPIYVSKGNLLEIPDNISIASCFETYFYQTDQQKKHSI